MVLFFYLGIAGIVLLLTGFYLNYTKRIKRNSRIYDLLNFFGAGFLGVYSISINSIPFIFLQFIWALIALFHLIRREMKKYGLNVINDVLGFDDTPFVKKAKTRAKNKNPVLSSKPKRKPKTKRNRQR